MSTLTETTNNRGLTICGTAVAAIAVLYLLNAFVQSGYINALELVAGAFWIGGCFLTSRWLNALGILVVSFTSSLVWGFWVDSQPVSDFLNFHNQAARVAEGGSLWSSLGSKSPPTVVYYAAFHALLGSDYATNYFAGAIAWTAGALLIYRAYSRSSPLAKQGWSAHAQQPIPRSSSSRWCRVRRVSSFC